ncbi:hypothetical protein OG21DRAFT_1480537 [Imleria badia]|nr:hypothetical protein OG21DRAFT_1480537 [Imleria badia]
MDERSEPTSTMCDLSVDVSDPYHSHPAPYRLQHPLASRTPSPSLPEIPAVDLDLTCSFNSILGTNPEPPVERMQKRASNVLKLTQENEKLKEELRAMTARLEAAERRRQEIANRQLQQTQQQQPSTVVADTHPARSQGSS